jgi:chromosome segregation ATPase
MSGSNNGRSWFEGTLDVISGSVMAPRSSTPTRNSQHIHRSISAPNSPARNNSSNNSTGNSVNSNSNNNSSFAPITRLPSLDSLDRSIHNDSGHGKSTAQIIRDLKQSNSRITARTAALEVDFMNQLQQTTQRSSEKIKALEDGLNKKEKHVTTLESRCKMAETRIREKDEGLTKLKEESAFQRHAISDLKRQLHQLSEEQEANSTSAGAGAASDDWTMEKASLYQELETLQKDAARHAEDKRVTRQEINKLQQRVEADGQAALAERSARSMPDPESGDARELCHLPGSVWSLACTEYWFTLVLHLLF